MVIAILGLVMPTAPAQAVTTVVVSGTTQATSSVGTSIVTGDIFTWSFTLDLDSTATSGSGFSGTFNNAVSAFTLTASSNNVGTWSPAGVNWVISPVFNLNTNANGDSMTLQVRATYAPPIDSITFFDLGITVAWDPSVVDVQNISGTPSLGTTLGTFSPDFDSASYYFELRDTNYSSASFVVPAVQPSSEVTSSVSAPQEFDMSLEVSEGIHCNTSVVNGLQDTWIQLPGAADCTPPATKSSAKLLGWATSPDFPVAIAKRQVDNGWGAYETFNDEGQITGVFIPAGGAIFLSAAGKLYLIWSE